MQYSLLLKSNLTQCPQHAHIWLIVPIGVFHNKTKTPSKGQNSFPQFQLSRRSSLTHIFRFLFFLSCGLATLIFEPSVCPEFVQLSWISFVAAAIFPFLQNWRGHPSQPFDNPFWEPPSDALKTDRIPFSEEIWANQPVYCCFCALCTVISTKYEILRLLLG
jgi:hypothetical protein